MTKQAIPITRHKPKFSTTKFEDAIPTEVPLKYLKKTGYTATEALFPLFVAVLEGFCWNTCQLVGYALLDIIQSTKIPPFQVVFESEE